MKKVMLAVTAAAILAVSATAASAATIVRVPDPTPNGAFTDSGGNQGYVEVRDDGVRACNENPGTPAGDSLSGYAWVDTGGDANAGHTDDDADPDGVTYGNGTAGAGDYDGEGADDGIAENGTEESDCPGENAP